MNIYIILGVLSILIVFRQFKSNFILYSLGTLPATFFHELTHFIVSLFTNGRPISFTILPKRIENDRGTFYELGSVGSANIRWYNSMFIGLSPFLLWVGAYLLYISIEGETLSTINIIKIVTIAMFIEGGLPSIPDFKIAFSKSYVFFIILGSTILLYPDIFPIILDKITILYETSRGYFQWKKFF